MKKILPIFFFFLLAISANAITLTVTNCSSSASDVGSLPWAVSETNSQLESVLINFNIPTSDAGYVTEESGAYFRIPITSMLTISRNSVSINGSTQRVFAGDTNPLGPEIEITCGTASTIEALIKLNSNNDCTIEGVAINGSTGSGIKISIGNRHKIYGCYIGTTATGETPKANASDGLYIDSSTLNIIGGLGSTEGNIISGNLGSGINFNKSTANKVVGNRIGLGTSEGTSLGNGAHGIYMHSESKNQTIETNIIAFNNNNGVLIDGQLSKFNCLKTNSMFSNTQEGIKLTSQANQNIAFPTITTAEAYILSGSTYVSGTSAPNARIEIFEVESPEAETAGEGKIFLASTEADPNGDWVTYIPTNEIGHKITATQTGTSFDTSQFALNKGPIAMAVEYRPDAEIGLVSDESDYVGLGIINSSGFGQSKSNTTLAGQKSTFYIKAKNTGTSSESLVIKGNPGDATWEVKYFNAKSAGSDITGQVTSDGYATSILATGEGIEFRVEVAALNSSAENMNVYISALSGTSGSKKDVVLATVVTSLPAQALNSFSFIFPSTAEAGIPFVATIEARDSAGNVTTEVTGITQLTVDYGTIIPAQISSVYFTDDGKWSGNIILSKAGTRRITATNGTIVGQKDIVVYSASAEFSDPSLGITIVIPNGAASEEVVITFSELSALPGNAPSGLWQAGKIIEINSNVTNFIKPISITMPIFSGASSPAVYYWNGSTWSQSGISGIVVSGGEINFISTHLTVFVPFDQAKAAQFIFGPNPYDPVKDGAAYFWYWLTTQKNTTLYLLDLSGNLVFKRDFLLGENGARGGLNTVQWDGKNGFNEYLQNGIYLYQLAQDGALLSRGKIIILRR